jgi:hypothetical protein
VGSGIDALLGPGINYDPWDIREPSSAAGWKLEESADEPQCTARSMVRNPAGRRKNHQVVVNGWQQLD